MKKNKMYENMEWIHNPIFTWEKKAVINYDTAEEIATLNKLLKGLLIELNALKREYSLKGTSKRRRKEIAEDIHVYLLDLEPIDPFNFKINRRKSKKASE